MDWRIAMVVHGARARRRRRRLCAAAWLAAVAGVFVLGGLVAADRRCAGNPMGRARADLLTLGGAALQFQLVEHGDCPARPEALVAAGLLSRIPLDPWGGTYRLECAPGRAPYVWSAGPDRRFGTDDDLDSSGFGDASTRR